MAYKGKFSIKHRDKYLGNPTKIIYRSLWEKQFMEFCDNNPNIIKWCSEEIIIPYYFPIDKKWHKYYPDFYIMYKTKNQEIKESVVEIKPIKQVLKPKRGKKRKRFLQENVTWVKNQSKWKYAGEYCKQRGWEFKIFTEKELFKWHTDK